ncbi:hypothetical protein COV16_00230, partial [Candidatus Woesearchaeota archaeon CG10_big_fil_rev_8_21_14_0_10_34_8]
IIGDGETAKGSITEAAKLAGVLQMNNMVNFLDYNKVDQDGYVKDVMPCQFVQEWQSYGWATIQVDGNDIEKLHIAIQEAHKIQEDQSLPVMIIMDTVKGAGVSFMAEAARGGSGAWHGVAPKGEYLINAIRECDETITDLEADILGDIDAYIQSIQLTLEEKEKFSVAVEQKIDSKPSIITFTEPKATRDGFGKYLLELGKADSRIVAVTAGVAGSVRMDWFEKKFGKFNSVNRAGRFINVGIAEANMAGVAAGLALAGKKPWFATFDIFITECLSVIRNSICYNNVDVKIIGTHAGLGVEWDGGSHQSCIIPGFMNDLFRMQCYEPADSNETQEIMKKVYTDNKAAYLRLTRQNMPLLASQIIKQGEGARVVRISENPKAVLVGMGVGVHIAMDAAKVLLSQGIDVKVINAFSLSNLDNDNFRSMIPNVPVVCFHDAHYKILAKEVAYVLGRKVVGIGMKDFGESGDAASLYKKHGMDVESIVSRVKGLIWPLHKQRQMLQCIGHHHHIL